MDEKKDKPEVENQRNDSSRLNSHAHAFEQERADKETINRQLSRIKHKILVLSGKGGVGKSAVAANLAVSLVLAGRKVGLLDIDIHGPSIPKILGLEGKSLEARDDFLIPVPFEEGNLLVMSIGFALPSESDAIIWRGPMKYSAIKQFLKDVAWGDLDYLIIDSPPGTGDEPLTIAQLINNPTGAIIVTTPQSMAISDVKKSITFCNKVGMPILGVIENMSGFVCPKCGEKTDIFKSGGGEKMAEEAGVPFLGAIPIDPRIVETSDAGKPFIAHFADTETAKAFRSAIRPVLRLTETDKGKEPTSGETAMKADVKNITIAVPVVEGRLSDHFGKADEFVFFTVDPDARKIIERKTQNSPPHKPGVLPQWLKEQGASVIITGRMGARAKTLFEQNRIEVFLGAPSDEPESVVQSYMEGTLPSEIKPCDRS